MEKFKCYISLRNINDSMELDSGQVIAELTTDTHLMSLEVCGDVRVHFDGDVFKCASQMPKELLKIIHDGEAFDNDRVNVIDNNWFELFLYEKDGKGWKWTGISDLWDCEGYTKKELKEEMKAALKEWLSDLEEKR